MIDQRESAQHEVKRPPSCRFIEEDEEGRQLDDGKSPPVFYIQYIRNKALFSGVRENVVLFLFFLLFFLFRQSDIFAKHSTGKKTRESLHNQVSHSACTLLSSFKFN